MARLRQNFISGTLSAQLTAAGTTMQAAALANVIGVAAPDHVVVTFYPVGSDPQVRWITAHTAAATTATVANNKEDTTSTDLPIGTPWKIALTADDLTYVGETRYNIQADKAWDPISADNSAAVQNSIASAAAASGGVVVVPPGGAYANVTVPTTARITIQGADASSVLTAVAGSSAPVIDTENFDALYASGVDPDTRDADGNWRCFLDRIALDGNADNCPDQERVWGFYGWAGGSRDVIIQNAKNKGLHSAWSRDLGSGDPVANEMSAHHRNLQFLGTGGEAWTNEGPHDSVCEGLTINGGQGLNNLPGGDNLHLSHYNGYNTDLFALRAETSVTGTDINVSGNGKVIWLPADAGRSLLTGINAAGADAGSAGLYVESGGHLASGVVQNCVADGLVIDGAANCQFWLEFENCLNAIDFRDDQGGHQLVAKVLTRLGQTTYTVTGAISASDLIFLRADGVGTNSSLIQIPNNVFGKANLYAAHGDAAQVGVGFAGPGGQSGINFQAGESSLYRDGANTLKFHAGIVTFDGAYIVVGTNSWVSGNGAPGHTAPRGSLYTRLDGSTGSTLYVSQGGGSWNAVSGV